ELLRRPDHGAGVVPAVPVRKLAPLLLFRVLDSPARAPRASRPSALRGALRRGLAALLHYGPLSDCAGGILMTSSRPGTATGPSRLSGKDKAGIWLILAFTLVALTLELYWLTFNQELETRTDLLVRLLAIYWPADYTFRIPGYSIEKSFTLSFEAVNVLLTPILSALLIRAILARKAYRYPLQ